LSRPESKKIKKQSSKEREETRRERISPRPRSRSKQKEEVSEEMKRNKGGKAKQERQMLEVNKITQLTKLENRPRLQ